MTSSKTPVVLPRASSASMPFDAMAGLRDRCTFWRMARSGTRRTTRIEGGIRNNLQSFFEIAAGINETANRSVDILRQGIVVEVQIDVTVQIEGAALGRRMNPCDRAVNVFFVRSRVRAQLYRLDGDRSEVHQSAFSLCGGQVLARKALRHFNCHALRV